MQSDCWVLNMIAATSSPSASGKSKGALLVSADAEIINIIKLGKNDAKNIQCFWDITILL